MDDLNCDFIHFFNTIYIKLIELCGSNLERFTPLKDLKKLGFHIICSKGNRGALANLLLFNEIASFFKIIEKYDYNFKECQTVYDLLYEKRNLLNIIDTIGIELCNKICKNLKEKEKLGMNPILFSVEDNFTMTEAGKKNLRNLSETFGCHIISLKPDIKTQKKVMLKTFEKYGKPTWFIDRLIYSYPFAMALKFNTPLLVYGENVSYEYGGSDDKETPSAKEIFLNGTASDLDINEFIDNEIKEENLQLFFNPNANDINKLNPIYLSYFVKWNSYSNYIFAKSRGFTDLEGEWDRTMCAENFDQVDSIGYILHAWMKYPKFGHACASDYAARFVRYGLLSRKEAIELVQKRDRKLDNRCVEDFCNFIGISKTTFWKIVEKHYNMDLFYKNDFGEFKLKNKLQ
ncbi:N-acetyl sugar amidotransferase [Campylobacter jejuni]|nr:N-acetyl sugar amidotransferase [Campylobacter jejuni]